MRRSRTTVIAFLAASKLWLVLFFAVPMTAMALYSFWQVVDYQIVADFTLGNYRRISGNLYVGVFSRTVRISVLVTVLSLLIGYPVAYFLAKKVRYWKLTLLLLVVMPLWTSYLIRTYAWMLILGTEGVVNRLLLAAGLTTEPLTWLLYSDFAVTIALIHIYIPYLILPLYAVLERIEPSILEAAWDLGSSRVRTFFTVILPLSLPGVATGCLWAERRAS
jgi:spermidine/putrescine transport system permease protein